MKDPTVIVYAVGSSSKTQIAPFINQSTFPILIEQIKILRKDLVLIRVVRL